MTDLFLTVLEISVSVSLIVVILLSVSPLLGRRYASKWKYLIWIFLAVRLLVPFNGADGRSAADMLVQWKNHITAEDKREGTDTESAAPAPRRIVVNIPERMMAPLMTTAAESVAILDIGAVIWLAGSFLFIAAHLISYLYCKRQVVGNGRYVKNAAILQQYLKIKRELHIRHTLPVIEFSEAASPMVLGFFRPVLVLPDEEYSREELFFILKHELVHWKRGDVYWKLLFVAANSVHWFNPFVWIMRKEAAVDMELSCDERVMKGADAGMKKAYTETLLSTLHRGCRKNITLSTGFYGGKRIMKKRFRNILQRTGKKNGVLLLVCAAVLTVSAGTLVGCSVVKDGAGDLPGNQAGLEESAGEIREQSQAASAQTEDPVVDDAGLAAMAGSWVIDFDRTDPMLWGTGRSAGDGMGISETGEFSYFIGIGIGGTGQCEAADGGVSVEITPYEEHSAEREILTLDYENNGGAEYILMDWHGEDVYWVRNAQSGEENTAKDRMTLTIMKEGMAEQKEAEIVVERGVLTGKEYALYLPVGEWQKAEADTWQAMANENVRIWVAGFEAGYPIGQILEDDGFVSDEEEMEREENGIRYRARLYESETSVWCVEYCFPAEAEEGWGQEMRVIADTFAEVEAESELLLGYITDLEENTVTVDLQDWLTSESENWNPEYDADAGFAVVDLEGADITYPIRDDCTYTILENHSGPDMEVDRVGFESYLQETDFPMLWGVELENGEVASLLEWYRP